MLQLAGMSDADALNRDGAGWRSSSIAVAGLTVLLGACSGGGGSGSGGASLPAATGTLTVSDCVIPPGDSACEATITWTTRNAATPTVLLGGATLSTTPAGNSPATVTAAGQTATLLDGSTRLDEKSVAGTCGSASAWDGTLCRTYAVRSVARAPTPFSESDAAVTLEVVVYTPVGTGPFPAVVFHHGSTGNGDDPTLFSVTYTSESIARFFAERGWLVAFPQRRGRGASDGTYDEGFTPDRSRYSCLRDPALAGFERALQDAEAAATYVASRDDVDATRMISAGTSRGGILAVVHAAGRPDLFDGAVNFVGGWLGEGCEDAIVVNRPTFVRGAAFPRPTLWLYGDADTFYSLSHSRANFDAFVGAGGRGSFEIFTRAPTLNGHFLVNDPALWSATLETFVSQLSP